ncbi:TonB-dependent receptor [Puteibacter caeruleilacunae]|nr:TonB-dependent receptor [Puteibacter caeruleilacunae]
MIKRVIFSLLLSVGTLLAGFANDGIIKGNIKDANNGEALVGATVFLDGTTIGTTSDFDGNYVIEKIPAGTYTLKCSYVSYNTSVKYDVKVNEGEEVKVVFELKEIEVELDDINVIAKVNRESENILLLDQKKAVEMKTVIGAQEISRKGVSDAEGAVTKVSGVTKQEGVKNVFVRGLGDRYNSTTLNGLPLPSDDPEYKNISLDLFSSDVINSVDVNKSFNPSIYGDVGGANIDIASKELHKEKMLQFDLSVGANISGLSEDFVKPEGANAFGSISDKKSRISNLNSYTFKNSYSPKEQKLPLNGGASVMAGKKFKINDNTLSAFGLVGYDNSYSYKDGVTRSTNAQGYIGTDLEFEKYSNKISKVALGNLKYELAKGGELEYNGVYIYNLTQGVSDYSGEQAGLTEVDGTSAFIRRQQINGNSVWVNQLLGQFYLNTFDLNLGISYNKIKGNEPDRRTNTYTRNGVYKTASGSAGYNNRYFSKLNEDDLAARFIIGMNFEENNEGEKKGRIEVGYNLRNTERDFEAIQFNHDFPSPTQINPEDPDQVFNQQSLDNNVFRLITGRGYNPETAFNPFTYDGSKTIHAALFSLNYQFNEQLTLVVGSRYEKVNQEVDWNTNLSSSENNPEGLGEIDDTFILPGLMLKYVVKEDNIFRLALSKSYTLPQFKEVAPFLYEDVNFASFGRVDLEPSDNYNVDIKWDRYYKPGELLSLTLFGKYIKNPINRTQVNSAANELSYINSGENAKVAGIELEYRKNIFQTSQGERMNKLMLGLNASYLYSIQKLTNPDASFTKDEDKLQGASPLLVNADLSYSSKREHLGSTFTLVVNYFSDRIYSIGTQNNQNIEEKGIPTVDFVYKASVSNKLSFKVSTKNLLNPAYELTKKVNTGETITVNKYKKGLSFSLGATYKF